MTMGKSRRAIRFPDLVMVVLSCSPYDQRQRENGVAARQAREQTKEAAQLKATHAAHAS
jgi:hypothetical protein